MNHRIAAPILVGLLAGPAAWASPGEHIRAGDAVITPSVDVGVEHRTNVYRTDADNPRQGTNIRISPQLEVSAEGPDLAFSLAGAYELRKYLQPELANLDRYSDFNVDANLEVLREQVLGFELNNSTGLRNREVERTFADAPFHTQFRNQFEGNAVVHAGPVLEFDLGGFWIYDDYFVPDVEQEGTRPFNYRHAFGPKAGAQWRFFPRTAFVVEGDLSFNRWNNNWVPTANANSDLGAFLALPDSTSWRAQAGVRGRVTDRLVLVIMGGYGGATYDETTVTADGGGAADETAEFAVDVRGLDGLLVTTQATLELSRDAEDRVSIGYRRSFEDSWFTNYLAYDEVYGTFDAVFGTRLGAHLSARVRLEDYTGEVERNDMMLRGEADVSYGLQDWARITAGVWHTERTSEPLYPEVEYGDTNVHVMATVLY